MNKKVTLERIETKKETCKGCIFNKKLGFCGARTHDFPCWDHVEQKQYIWVIKNDKHSEIY